MSYEYNPSSLGIKGGPAQPAPADRFNAPHQRLHTSSSSPALSGATALVTPARSYADPSGKGGTPPLYHHPAASSGSSSSSTEATSLSRIMDQVSPPNVVIGRSPGMAAGSAGLYHSQLAAAPPAAAAAVMVAEGSPRLTPVGLDNPEALLGSKYRAAVAALTSGGGSSSPEPEEARQSSKKSEAPPNRTISFESNPWTSWENIGRGNLSQPQPAFSTHMQPSSSIAIHPAGCYQGTPIAKQQQPPPPVGFNAADIKRFAEGFQFARIKAGYSYTDVVSSLSSLLQLPGTELDEFTVRKFEELNLPVSQAIKLKSHLEKWMSSLNGGHINSSSNNNNPIEISSKTSSDSDTEQQKKIFYGRKRTKIDSKSKAYMEAYFKHSQKPNYEELMAISSNTGLDRDVVRVWFSNRRQKDRRQRDSEGAQASLAMVAAIPAAAATATDISAAPAAQLSARASKQIVADSVLDWFPSLVSPTATAVCADQSRVQPPRLFLSSTSSSLGENPWSSGNTMKPPELVGFASSGAEQSAGEFVCAGKTSVIVSRQAQQQMTTMMTGAKEPAPRGGAAFEHTFLMTPRVEEPADRSDDDWSGCY